MNEDENHENRTLVPGNLEKIVPLPKVTIYLVTIKCNAMRYTDQSELLNMLETIKEKMHNVEWSPYKAYEVDSLNRMHLHTICKITGRAPLFKRLAKEGWHIHFNCKRNENTHRLREYIIKDAQDPANQWIRFAKNSYYWDNLSLKPRPSLKIKYSDIL